MKIDLNYRYEIMEYLNDIRKILPDYNIKLDNFNNNILIVDRVDYNVVNRYEVDIIRNALNVKWKVEYFGVASPVAYFRADDLENDMRNHYLKLLSE